MTKEEVVELMKSSKSVAEWDENCDIVKACNGGVYPGFWYEVILISGLAADVKASWWDL